MAEPIWVVSRGSYSDYRVLAAFDSKQTAQIAASMDDDFTLEALDVFSREELTPIHIFEMQVNVWDDGSESAERDEVRTELPFNMLWPERKAPVNWRWVRAPIHRGLGGRLEVHGTDFELVKKVFIELRARLHAEDAFRLKKTARR